MTQQKLSDSDLFLRGARGDEFEAYAALMAEADALHHTHHPALIKPPDQATPQEADFLACLRDPNQLLDVAVLDQDGKQTLVGFIQGVLMDRPEGRAHKANRVLRIELIVVAAHMRRQNIGRSLIGRAKNWGLKKHAHMVVLNSYAFNIVAGRLYEKEGFSILTKMYALTLD